MRARAAALVAVGLLAMIGDLSGLVPLVALGTAWGASPAPRVFASRDGLEGFSSRFRVVGTEGEVTLDPATYARLRGPYNRRNVYGAALAGGPWLAEHPHLAPLYDAVAEASLCRGAPVLRELGVDVGEPIVVLVEPRPGTRTALPLALAPPCR